MSQSSTIPARLDDWARSEAIPFDMTAGRSFDSAVDRMVAAMGELVELLGFGEPMHGAAELLVLRNRLFQRLVEAHGFTAIAVESSFPRARVVNEYVSGGGSVGGPATYDDIEDAGFSHGFGLLAANRELVEWMRQYNAQAARTAKLHFYGFDSPTEMMWSDSPRRLLEFVLDYLGSVGGGGEERRKRIAGLLGEDAAWENQEAAFDPAKSIGLSPAASALRMEVEELVSELDVRRLELMAGSDGGRYLEAVHYAALARQLLNYHAAVARVSNKRIAQLLGLRDAMMADNLAYIVARERGRGRVLAFSHNSHLKRGKTEWQLGADLLEWWPAGAHLGAMLGTRYAVIGTGVGTSEAHGIGPPEPGAIESHLTAAPGPGRFCPTHRGQSLDAAMVATIPTRASNAKNSTYFPLTAKSLVDFDWLAVLDSIS
jgi:erythromycin esterase-like protein